MWLLVIASLFLLFYLCFCKYTNWKRKGYVAGSIKRKIGNVSGEKNGKKDQIEWRKREQIADLETQLQRILWAHGKREKEILI